VLFQENHSAGQVLLGMPIGTLNIIMVLTQESRAIDSINSNTKQD
jgi:hypothetical protein